VTLKSIPTALVQAFWSRVDGVIGPDKQNALARRAAKAETIVIVYYVYMMAVSYGRISTVSRNLHRKLQPSLDLALTSWIPLDSWRLIALGLALLMLVASLLAARLPRWRIPRFLAIGSFVMLEAMAFDQGGKISHDFHPLVWAGIAFCFLPSLKNDSSERCRNYLASFFGAQVFVCLLYTCAGLSKVIGIALDWSSGVTWLDPEALPLMLAANGAEWRVPEYFPIRSFLVLNPWAAWLSNVGVLYLEIAAVFAVFRPRLHRLWALGLLIMHAMIWVTMVIQFRQSAFAVGLILLASPFASDKLSLKETLLDLPVVRFVHQRLRARRGAGADGPLRDAPWQPHSMVMKLWIPVLVVVYLCVAFGNFDKNGGFIRGSGQLRSRPGGEVYPISAMPMFMRINSSEANFEKLGKLRGRFESKRRKKISRAKQEERRRNRAKKEERRRNRAKKEGR